MAGEEKFGREVVQGRQDEGALEHPRMRQGETRVVQARVAVQEQIEVEGARASSFTADATAGLLDG